MTTLTIADHGATEILDIEPDEFGGMVLYRIYEMEDERGHREEIYVSGAMWHLLAAKMPEIPEPVPPGQLALWDIFGATKQ